MRLTRKTLRRLILETIQEITSDSNPGTSSRERMELEYGSDDPYFTSDTPSHDSDYDTSDPFRHEFTVDGRPATAAERKAAQQRALEARRKAQERERAARAMYRRMMLGDDY